MTKFSKGQSGNPSGRPKGSPNKATQELRETLSTVLMSEMTPSKLKKLLRQLEPEKRLYHLTKLSEFILPKLKETDMNLSFESLTDEQLDSLIDRILNPKSENGEKNENR